MEETILTPEEQKLVADFAARIDIENTNQILQYGAGTQKKMADFSDAALANVKTQELGEAGDLIAEVVGELRDFDATEEKGIFGFFKKQSNKIEAMKNRYAKAEVNVQKIVDSLQEHQIRLMKDSAMLDKMYQQNLNYYKELTMYILAGKKKLEESAERPGCHSWKPRLRSADLPRMPRKQRIWIVNVTGLRRSCMTWSLQGPFPCRLHHRSVWYKITIPLWLRRSRLPL